VTVDEINALRFRCETDAENPRNIKVNLAKLIINDFHSPEAAFAAEDEFNRRFVKKEMPDEIEESSIAAGTYKVADLIVQTNLAASKGEAKRLIEQGGVKMDGEKVSDAKADFTINSGDDFIFQVGKLKFLRVKGN
jgi:tyrosyl-tRNA synthetase